MAFTPLRSVLESILRASNFDGDPETCRIFSSWDDMVGLKISAHARPSRIANRILYVEVDDPLWMAQLKYMREMILEKVSSCTKQGAVRDLKFFLKNL